MQTTDLSVYRRQVYFCDMVYKRTFILDVAIQVFFDAGQFKDLINVAVRKSFSCCRKRTKI